MVAQIIFFATLALFLVLMIRRVPMSRSLLANLASSLRSLGATIASFITNLGRRRVRKAAPNAVPTVPATNHARHQFWQEEQISQKPEILSHLEEGEALLKAGNYAEAEKLLLLAATRNPKDSRVYAKLGFLYLQTKSYNDAIEALKVAAKLDKHNPTRHYNLGLAYWGNKNNQRAIASIREAISLDPVTPKYRQFLEELLNKK